MVRSFIIKIIVLCLVSIKAYALDKVLLFGDSLMAGDALMGRVFDALGNPIDNLPDPVLSDSWPLMGKKLNPLSRATIDKPMDVGVRAINSLLSVGRGQRLGIIAGSGVGKSVLLGMMTRFTSADVVVVGLIGERGREVGRAFPVL